MKKMMKKVATMALALGCAAIVIGGHGISGKAATFAGGNGTSADPYVVENAAQLQEVRNYNGCYFVQSKDIDCGYKKMNDVFGTAAFTGNYNGNGHKISNIIASGNDATVISSIGKGGVLTNVTFSKLVISGGDNAALVKDNQGTINGVSINNSRIKTGRSSDGTSNAALFCINNGSDGIISSCKAKKNSINCKANAWLGAIEAAGICVNNDGQISNTKLKKLSLKLKSVQFSAKGAGLVLRNNCSVIKCSATIDKTATSYGDKNGNYGAREFGTLAKRVSINRGIVSGCKVTGKFKADKKVKK
ncbi:MAG: hypothetical protein E7301_01670 [Butyrivibrio sp.]|nr:hypothetical protein [Butyrivibrio sp.]